MSKKIVAIILVLVFILSSSVLSSSAEWFYDCSDWAKPEVSKAIFAKILDTRFPQDLTQVITRLEFCDLAVNTYFCFEKRPSSSGISPFSDANYPEVAYAYKLGIVKGATETSFLPDNPITREEMATMMSRIARALGHNPILADIKNFNDCEEISDWALADMEFMVGVGIIKGDKNDLLPRKNTTREQAVVMMWRLYRYLGGEDIKLYEETTKDILVDLNIVDRDMLESDETLSLYDFLVILAKSVGNYTEETGDISDWYVGDTLASMDHLDDSKKALLLRLCNSMFIYEEIPKLDLDGEITQAEALYFIYDLVDDSTRIGDAYIHDGKSVFDFDKTELYDNAYKKRLIASNSTDNADEHITYKELCDILYKALFTEHLTGGHNISIVRPYDNHIKKAPVVKADTEYEMIEIPVSPRISTDLSVRWSLPDEYKFIKEEDFCFSWGGRLLSGAETKIESTDMLEYIMGNQHDENQALRCTYNDFENDIKYYFDIDLPDIKVVTEGKEIKPGKYITFKESWCAKEITLGDYQKFEKDCYYMLISYEKRYRNDEYNSVDHTCFKVTKTANNFIGPTNRSFGVVFTDEIRIQKITVSGNRDKGFVISVTPESSDVFRVVDAGVKM